jgi:hypothetical protein
MREEIAMSQDAAPLSDEERAELEELRAEKAALEAAERARKERAELERLRAQSAQREAIAQQEAMADARARAARERASKFMEPGDDLSMPLGQRIVLIGLALVVIAIVVALVLGGR